VVAMAPTRASAAAAAGVFDAQSAVERLEAEMTGISEDITELKKSAVGIAEIKHTMVTMDALDSLMQKYLTIQSSPSGVTQLDASGTSLFPNLKDKNQFPTLPVSIPVNTNATVWSVPLHTAMAPASNTTPLMTSLGSSTVLTDSVRCTTTRQPDVNTQTFQHFQVPPISFPLHHTREVPPSQIPPNPGIWSQTSSNPYQVNIPPNFNPVTRQFLPVPTVENNFHSGFRMAQTETDRNERVQQLGGISYYADAVLKGPRLEIPLFAGDDPIG